LTTLIHAIDQFDKGEGSVEDVRAQLDAAASLLESDIDDVDGAMRLAEADLEEIRFARLLVEQRRAAVFRLDELRGHPGGPSPAVIIVLL
jgi:hypothetical protein